MNRREFLALSGTAAFAAQFDAQKRRRVGLIGTGWYGKADLLRLIQVAPVEVVSLCDVDRRMLGEAAALVASRQVSKKTPRTYADYRGMRRGKGHHVLLDPNPDHSDTLCN